MTALVCSGCGIRAEADPRLWRCRSCQSPFDIAGSPPLIAAARGPGPGLWRYAAWLPTAVPVSLGEVATPLVAGPGVDQNVSLKLEYLLPTGSFKDRGMAVLVSWLREHHVDHVINDSSGNAGASLAAYAARAGIGCEIFVPESASSTKLAQIKAYGATLIRVPGPRAAARVAAQDAADRTVYATHLLSPMFLAGTETFAFELWEQTEGRLPDAVVVPVGGGSLLLGAASGFRRLLEAGLTQRIPRLFGVQAERCAPLVPHDRGSPGAAPGPCADSVAEGIMIADPPRGQQVVAAVAATGGSLVAVTEEAIERARGALARSGFLVEPTSAAAYAGLTDLRAAGTLRADEQVVVAMTGSGLKTTAPGPRSVQP